LLKKIGLVGFVGKIILIHSVYLIESLCNLIWKGSKTYIKLRWALLL